MVRALFNGLGAFLFLFYFSFLYFGGVLNNTNIPLALIGYEMICLFLYRLMASYDVNARLNVIKIQHCENLEI